MRQILLLSIFLVQGWISSISIFGQNIRVEASFSPSSISSTSRSTYKVVVHGTQQNPQGTIPKVSGLRISNNPQSLRSANFINGVPSVRVELSFQTMPEGIGTYTVPSWNINIDGKVLRVPQASLQVLAPSQSEKKAQQDLRQAAFLEFPLEKPYLFEGETMLAPLTLFIWDRLPVNRIENAPIKIGASFSSNKLGKWSEEKRNVGRNGKLYSTFTWPVAITAAMAGTKQIGFEVNLRVRVNTRRNSPFSSPFFNDPFFGFGREESLTVSLPTKEIEIKPLPISNRPSNFSGAIGSFQAIASVDTKQVEIGDPVRFNFSIEGKGNFAAIPAPNLESSAEFKIGPPGFLFQGDEKSKFEGKQSFEYIITPIKSGSITLPSINFAYFDPNLEKYNTISTQKINLQVQHGERWSKPESKIVFEKDNSLNGKEAETMIDLFQTASDPGQWYNSLKNDGLEKKTWFWMIQILPLTSAVSLVFFGWKKRNKIADDFRLKKATLNRKLKESVENRDAIGFFRAFKDLIRLQISLRDRTINTFAFSTRELVQFIKKQNTEKSLVGEIEEMLSLGEDLEFGDTNSKELDFKKLQTKGSEILKKL